ncbi:MULTISPECIES: YceD family protein [Comamonas]|jgi:uncharacterized protein|uniref:Large ribosomal RNA subunit accumulation protein YceD n=1 Tax=Comamonas terrigena TaxID=32013 RepID=A0A2A7UZA4_COMTR|nr:MULTISPECIES: YceD family protein [Comamonas]MBD9531874.1 DUF177 domain-containing protein [Comamonas sp. CMM01]MBV7419738.1 DUF177 domain-containing protein [Comamonas sp. CMM03]MDH1290300.1 YceD family protein [Comamonas terrigena]MDI9854448.1 YceD family protein [Comamonas sp. 17RB]PEH90587.1 hypothetical protein CRM82_20055 [Comamonas terrigena]
MSKDFSPDHLDVKAFAQAGATLTGSDPLSRYTRLAQDAEGPVDGLQVDWRAEGELRAESGGASHLWLHLTVEAGLPLTCQRCLQLDRMPLQVDRSFRFVADEATAEALDDEAEEDLLALSRDFDLRALIEDELLMALPLVPRHEVCPQELPMQSSDADFEQASEEKPNPFAVLQGLRKNGAPD